MPKFSVLFGAAEAVVYADNEQGAWAKFADGHDVARKHPHLYEKVVVEEVAPAEVVSEPELEAVDEEVDGD